MDLPPTELIAPPELIRNRVRSKRDILAWSALAVALLAFAMPFLGDKATDDHGLGYPPVGLFFGFGAAVLCQFVAILISLRQHSHAAARTALVLIGLFYLLTGVAFLFLLLH